jgi:hypothetical protein
MVFWAPWSSIEGEFFDLFNPASHTAAANEISVRNITHYTYAPLEDVPALN